MVESLALALCSLVIVLYLQSRREARAIRQRLDRQGGAARQLVLTSGAEAMTRRHLTIGAEKARRAPLPAGDDRDRWSGPRHKAETSLSTAALHGAGMAGQPDAPGLAEAAAAPPDQRRSPGSPPISIPGNTARSSVARSSPVNPRIAQAACTRRSAVGIRSRL